MSSTAGRSNPRARKWILAGGAILLVLIAAFAILAFYSAPLLRERAVRMLAERFNSDVSLDKLRVSLFPGIGVAGSGLALRQKGEGGKAPVLRVRKFSARTGILELFRSPPHIDNIRLDGLEIDVTSHHHAEGGASSGGRRIHVNEITADDAVLKIIPEEAGKETRVFAIHRLTLHAVAHGQPMSFHAVLRNPQPPGEIDSSGTFGPWQEKDPARTPVSGSYAFEHADLGVFSGISGTLSSRGKYAGELGHIEVDGETDTPDFTVRVSGQPVHLRTRFHGIVDGTNGDTLLHPVDARFERSTVHCWGSVIHETGPNGKTVSLDVIVANARIEDLLRLVVKGKPTMTGTVRLHTKFILPPGSRQITDRLYLDGDFGVGGARFTSATVQDKIAQLSHRAEGHPKEGDIDAARVASNFRGHFTLKDGIAMFSNLTFTVPGAAIALDGTYGLNDEKLDFSGTARLDATLSQMTTGWKSLLLKAADPFFKKHGAGTYLPLKITGTREHPSFDLIFRK